MRYAALVSLGFIVLLAVACEREQREFAGSRAESQEREIVALTRLSPGGTSPDISPTDKGRHYENNAFQQSEGKRLFAWFNCTGCHGHGGGGSGPALMDDKWIYGDRIENIVETIREGRPNGMPSFRGKIPDDEIWQLAAYVRSLSGNAAQTAASSRDDDMNPHPAENRLPTQPPVHSGVPQ